MSHPVYNREHLAYALHVMFGQNQWPTDKDLFLRCADAVIASCQDQYVAERELEVARLHARLTADL